MTQKKTTKKQKVSKTITSSGATSVRISYEDKPIKTLRIDFDGIRPKFSFSGLWSGKDMHVVLNNLRRAYHTHTRQLRRELMATNKKEK